MVRRYRRSKRKEAKKPTIPPRLVSSLKKLRKFIPAAIAAALFTGLVAAAYVFLPPELSLVWHVVLGLVWAVLACLLFVFTTRQTGSFEEQMLSRLRRGQHADFGKRLRKPPPKPRTVKLPMLGETKLRVLGGLGVFLATAGWWYSPLAPVKVREREIEDLVAPLEEEIAAVVLAMANEQMAVVQPPVPPALARQRARLIDDAKVNSYLQGLKAIAQSRYDDARALLARAMRDDAAEPFAIHVARAQNEMYSGQYGDAMQWYDNALRQKPDSPLLLCQMAVAYVQTGEFAKAEPLIARALGVCREKPAESSDSDAALGVCLHVQAALNVCLGKGVAEAEQMCVEARRVCEKGFDRPHPFEAASLNNQAVLYLLQGKYPGADELFAQSGDAWSRLPGAHGRHSADSLGNQAMLYCRLGRYTEAKEQAGQALVERTQFLAEAHPLVALSRNALARACVAAGPLEQAQPLAESALAAVEKALGPENAAMPAVLDTLGLIYAEQARYTRAETTWRRAETIAKKLFGPKHLYVAGILQRLADLYVLQERYPEAEELCQQVFDILKPTCGLKHPSIAALLNTRARLEIGRGQSGNAGPLLTEAWAIWQERQRSEDQSEAIGSEHPDEVIRTLVTLAALDDNPRDYTKAVARYKQALEIAEKHFGADHAQVARLMHGQARLYLHGGKYAQARPCAEEAIRIERTTLVPYHPDLAAALETCAAALRQSGASDSEEAARAAKMEADARAIRAQHADEDRPE